jgi:hypothetical protein
LKFASVSFCCQVSNTGSVGWASSSYCHSFFVSNAMKQIFCIFLLLFWYFYNWHYSIALSRLLTMIQSFTPSGYHDIIWLPEPFIFFLQRIIFLVDCIWRGCWILYTVCCGSETGTKKRMDRRTEGRLDFNYNIAWMPQWIQLSMIK